MTVARPPKVQNPALGGPASLSRSDRKGARIWIEAALEMIAENGDEDIRIERLARRIKMSKGSFYWFFSGIDDLRYRALEHWKLRLNDQVFERVRQFDGSMKDQLVFLTNEIFDSGLGRFDAAIRAWALRDVRVDRFIRNVDADRLTFLQELFSRSCADHETSTFQAHLFYRVLIAESFVRQRPDNMDGRRYIEKAISQTLAIKNRRRHEGNGHDGSRKKQA